MILTPCLFASHSLQTDSLLTYSPLILTDLLRLLIPQVLTHYSYPANSSSPALNILSNPVSIHWMSNTYCSPQLPKQYTHSSLLNHTPDSRSQAFQAPFPHYQLQGYS